MAAAGLAVVGSPASAIAETPAKRAAEIVKLLGEFGAGAKAYGAIAQEALALELFTMDGARQAIDLAKAGGPPTDASDWSRMWRGQLADKVALLKAHKASLQYPTGAINELVRLDPTYAERAPSLRELPAAMDQDIDNILNIATAVDADIAAAAQRDRQAISNLGLDVVDGARVQLEGENAIFRLAEAAVGPKHPQYALSKSMAASNQAIIELYTGLAAQLRHQDVDTSALAKRVADRCDEARADAEQITVLAARSRSQLDGKGTLPAAVQAGFYKGWDTYADSARNEVAIAAECSKMAVAVSQGTSIADVAAASQLKPLADQRIAIDAQRRAYMSGTK